MTTEDILLAAGEAKPDLMEKVAEAIVHLEETDKDAASDLLKELDSIASYACERTKTAAINTQALKEGAKGVAKTMGKGGAIVGGMLLAGLGAAVATDLYDAAKRGLTRSSNLNRIMEANPELKKSFDKDRLRQSYDAIHRFAPEITADPLVGGSVLKSVAELPGNEFSAIKAVIDARKSLQESKSKAFVPMKLDMGKGGGSKP